MTPKQINTAIAEWIGWTKIQPLKEFDGKTTWAGTNPEGFRELLPDFYNDLNAMHEAEGVLTHDQEHAYGAELHRLCVTKDRHICYEAVRATAHQRAEAFLRTIGKWI